MAKTNRTPTGTDRLKADLARLNAEDAGRRRDRLADPTDSSHFDFDPALAPDPPVRAEAEAVHPVWGERWVPDPADQVTVVTAADLSAAASPRGGPMADPPATPDVQQSSSEPSTSSPAGSGGGSGRSLSHRSIGRPIANTAFDAAKGVPVEVQDEQAHAREATEILLEAAADHYRHNELMPYARLLDLHAVVEHMVEARRVVR